MPPPNHSLSVLLFLQLTMAGILPRAPAGGYGRPSAASARARLSAALSLPSPHRCRASVFKPQYIPAIQMASSNRRTPYFEVNPSRTKVGAWPQELNITENGEGYNYILDTQGMMDDLKITLRGNVMTVAGNQKISLDEGHYRSSFERSFKIPDDADLSTLRSTELENGRIRVVAKKSELRDTSKSIRIEKINDVEKTAETKNAPSSYFMAPSSQPEPPRSPVPFDSPRSPDPISPIAPEEMPPKATPVSGLRNLVSSFLSISDDWEEIEGAWVLRPPSDVPWKAVVHFTGGAFASSIPQITYNLFLSRLASRGVVVVATPYATRFDYGICADQAISKFNAAAHVLAAETDPVSGHKFASLPVYGIGHSLGSVVQLLLNSRSQGIAREGNVLMSFNNKPASEAMPAISSLIGGEMEQMGLGSVAPMLQSFLSGRNFNLGSAGMMLNNLLENEDPLATFSPMLMMLGLTPDQVETLTPVVDQLKDLSADMSSGPMEFNPTPSQLVSLVSNGYNTRRNLLVRFDSDPIDQTPAIESLLRVLNRDIRVKSLTLNGGHLRPNAQNISNMSQKTRPAETVTSQNPALEEQFPGLEVTPSVASDDGENANVVEDMEELVTNVTNWMGI